MEKIEYPFKESSLIDKVVYDYDTEELEIYFIKYYVDKLTYVKVSAETFNKFIDAKSAGKYYLGVIKPFYKLKTTKHMADLVIKCKIDVTKVIKEWLFTGQKGTYLNVTVLYNAEKDQYGNNGQVVQDVPTEIYKKDKSKKGPILGNNKTFDKVEVSEEVMPGKEVGTMAGNNNDPKWDDDLPF